MYYVFIAIWLKGNYKNANYKKEDYKLNKYIMW